MLQGTRYWSLNKMSILIYYIQCWIHFGNNITSVIYFKIDVRVEHKRQFAFSSLFLKNKNDFDFFSHPFLAVVNHSGIQRSGLNTGATYIIQLLWKTTLFSWEDLRGKQVIFRTLKGSLVRFFFCGEPFYVEHFRDGCKRVVRGEACWKDTSQKDLMRWQCSFNHPS